MIIIQALRVQTRPLYALIAVHALRMRLTTSLGARQLRARLSREHHQARNDNMNKAYEREEDMLIEQVLSGEITQAEYKLEMRLMREAYQAEAEDAAQQAYDDEMRNW
jgi:hypothetical protein